MRLISHPQNTPCVDRFEGQGDPRGPRRRGPSRSRGLFAFLLITAASLHSAEAQIDRQERHRVPAAFMTYLGAEWLEREDRRVEEQPQRVLEAMALEPGDVVADVGCGSGYYARQMAPFVQPGGTVYCEDIQPEMLELMQGLAAEEDVTGVQPILGTPLDPKLPEGQVDWVLITDVYHEMSDPEPMLAGIRRALSPGGRVALLEYRVEDGTGDQIKADHRMSVRQVLLEWKAAGFALAELHDFLPSQHLFFFRSAADTVEASLDDYDLFDAIDTGLVEAEAVGAGNDAVTIRIRRTGDRPIAVTSPVGTYFRSDGGPRDIVARRDGWVVLSDAEWRDWTIRGIGRQRERRIPTESDSFEILRPSTEPHLERLMYQIQVGTYTVSNSPTLYPFVTNGVEQAAVWITDSDLDYGTIAADVEGPRMPAQYAVAFALVFADRAGVDVTARRIWNDAEHVFGVLRDQGLGLWYQLKSTGR